MNFVDAVAYHFCLAWPAAYTQPWADLLAVYYSIHLIHSSGPAMDPPALNVSATGVVPEEDGGGKFAVSLPCTGKATAEVDFLLEESCRGDQ